MIPRYLEAVASGKEDEMATDYLRDERAWQLYEVIREGEEAEQCALWHEIREEMFLSRMLQLRTGNMCLTGEGNSVEQHLQFFVKDSKNSWTKKQKIAGVLGRAANGLGRNSLLDLSFSLLKTAIEMDPDCGSANGSEGPDRVSLAKRYLGVFFDSASADRAIQAAKKNPHASSQKTASQHTVAVVPPSSIHNWREYQTRDGRRYYHNFVTNETQWNIPPGWGNRPQTNTAQTEVVSTSPGSGSNTDAAGDTSKSVSSTSTAQGSHSTVQRIDEHKINPAPSREASISAQALGGRSVVGNDVTSSAHTGSSTGGLGWMDEVTKRQGAASTDVSGLRQIQMPTSARDFLQWSHQQASLISAKGGSVSGTDQSGKQALNDTSASSLLANPSTEDSSAQYSRQEVFKRRKLCVTVPSSVVNSVGANGILSTIGDSKQRNAGSGCGHSCDDRTLFLE